METIASTVIGRFEIVMTEGNAINGKPFWIVARYEDGTFVGSGISRSMKAADKAYFDLVKHSEKQVNGKVKI